MTPGGLYNLRRVLNYVPKNLGTLLDFKKEMSSSPSFCHTELQRALKEQAFGIKKYSLSASTSHQAIATIVLLEGGKLLVELTTQGYSIVSTTKIHETIEDLLQSASPMYVKRRQEVLYAKLAKLSSS